MDKTGFAYDGKRIFFIDEKGKDCSFERWRASLYYAPNYAKTAFFDSEENYRKFIEIHGDDCFSEYADFRKWFEEKNEETV